MVVGEAGDEGNKGTWHLAASFLDAAQGRSEPQTLNQLSNMLKDLKKIMDEELKETKNMMYEWEYQ